MFKGEQFGDFVLGVGKAIDFGESLLNHGGGNPLVAAKQMGKNASVSVGVSVRRMGDVTIIVLRQLDKGIARFFGKRLGRQGGVGMTLGGINGYDAEQIAIIKTHRIAVNDLVNGHRLRRCVGGGGEKIKNEQNNEHSDP